MKGNPCREIRECIEMIEKEYLENDSVTVPHFLYRKRVLPHVIFMTFGDTLFFLHQLKEIDQWLI